MLFFFFRYFRLSGRMDLQSELRVDVYDGDATRNASTESPLPEKNHLGNQNTNFFFSSSKHSTHIPFSPKVQKNKKNKQKQKLNISETQTHTHGTQWAPPPSASRSCSRPPGRVCNTLCGTATPSNPLPSTPPAPPLP